MRCCWCRRPTQDLWDEETPASPQGKGPERRARRRHGPAVRSREAARAGPGGGVGWVQLGSPERPSLEPGPDPPWPPPGPPRRNPEKREGSSRVACPARGRVIQ
ncbi:putative Tubulin Polyglutamylase Ttll1 [Manis pentadactyla]|nr:putative Tubulin Polyglutamylase Ttll1 [Manis pentadactyla]